MRQIAFLCGACVGAVALAAWFSLPATGARAEGLRVVSPAAGRGEAEPASAAAAVPVVVELFTSEGCSSCPPADRLLRDLTEDPPIDTALVIPLGEHVDYWDRLGWTDPFSDARFTSRQSAYAARRGSNQIYTPQMVVDGGEGFVGSNRAAAVAAIRRAAARPKPAVSLAWSSTAPPILRIGVAAASDEERLALAGADVMLAVTQDGLSTDVRRGENAGRTLAHVGVVRRFEQIGRVDRDGRFADSREVPLDADWRGTGTLRAVVLVQPGGREAVVAAGALSLPSPGESGR